MLEILKPGMLTTVQDLGETGISPHGECPYRAHRTPFL